MSGPDLNLEELSIALTESLREHTDPHAGLVPTIFFADDVGFRSVTLEMDGDSNAIFNDTEQKLRRDRRDARAAFIVYPSGMSSADTKPPGSPTGPVALSVAIEQGMRLLIIVLSDEYDPAVLSAPVHHDGIGAFVQHTTRIIGPFETWIYDRLPRAFRMEPS